MSTRPYPQRFSVSFDYPVHFTRDLFDVGNSMLYKTLMRKGEQRRHRVFVCVDAGVVDGNPDLLKKIEKYFHTHADCLQLVDKPRIIQGGETCKDLSQVQELLDCFAANHLCRQSYVVTIGGGSVLDMVGLAASLVHRGLRYVRVPSTVLSQNDAGVGVKNGVNAYGQKNFLGTFAPPFAVIDDFDLLKSLSDESWRAGISEAFKVAIIKDKSFFKNLCATADRLRNRDQNAMEALVERCAVLHLEHIANSGDAFEMGSARPLDFGHWSAHKLENLSNYRIGHGQAVAVGIALDSFYAKEKYWISDGAFDAICEGLFVAGLPLYYDELGIVDEAGDLAILGGIHDFHEHLGGELNVTFPDGIGKKLEVHSLDHEIYVEAVKALQNSSYTESCLHENQSVA